MKKQIFAMPAAAIATPPNPKIAAKSAIRKKVSAQFSMFVSLWMFRSPVSGPPEPRATSDNCRLRAMQAADRSQNRGGWIVGVCTIATLEF